MRTTLFAGLSLAVLALGAGYVRAGDDSEFKSGLQPGDSLSPFQCRDITGPNKGKSLCYV